MNDSPPKNASLVPYRMCVFTNIKHQALKARPFIVIIIKVIECKKDRYRIFHEFVFQKISPSDRSGTFQDDER